MAYRDAPIPVGLQEFAALDARIAHLPPSDGSCYYHGTHAGALPFIAREGLLARYDLQARGRPSFWKKRSAVYFTRDPQTALRFAKTAAAVTGGLPALLLVRLDGLTVLADGYADMVPFDCVFVEPPERVTPDRIVQTISLDMSPDLAAAVARRGPREGGHCAPTLVLPPLTPTQSAGAAPVDASAPAPVEDGAGNGATPTEARAASRERIRAAIAHAPEPTTWQAQYEEVLARLRRSTGGR